MPYCEQCGKEHDGTFASGRFCCRSCSNKYVALHQSPESKAKKVSKGIGNLSHTWVGRSCNKKGQPTESEQYVINLLNNIGVQYQEEVVVSKRSLGIQGYGSYSLDFYFDKAKLDLEIDGTTHLKPDRKQRDSIRDNALQLNGYNVRRVFFNGNYNDLRKDVIEALKDFEIY